MTSSKLILPQGPHLQIHGGLQLRHMNFGGAQTIHSLTPELESQSFTVWLWQIIILSNSVYSAVKMELTPFTSLECGEL